MNDRLRVLILADPSIPVPPVHYGGIERIIDMLCSGLIAKGHEVAIAAHRDSTANCKLYPLPNGFHRPLGEAIQSVFCIRKAVQDFRPDVIHSFARLAYLWPFLWSTTPKIMSYQREPNRNPIRYTSRFARRDSLLFTGCSDYITKKIKQWATAATVYNGVPPERFTFVNSVTPDAPLVFLGRIEQIKGTHNAIKIAQLTGRRLIIAGNQPQDPESRRYFETRIKPNLSNRIEYIGPVDDTQKNDLLGSAAAMVMAIEWDEPFGIVLAESLACGTPILGTPRGAVPEIIEDGITGFIRKTAEELAETVDKLPQLCRNDCRSVCEARFTSETIVEEYLRQYQQLLVRKN